MFSSSYQYQQPTGATYGGKTSSCFEQYQPVHDSAHARHVQCMENAKNTTSNPLDTAIGYQQCHSELNASLAHADMQLQNCVLDRNRKC